VGRVRDSGKERLVFDAFFCFFCCLLVGLPPVPVLPGRHVFQPVCPGGTIDHKHRKFDTENRL